MRQLLNVSYSIMAEGRDEDGLETLDVQLGMIDDPDSAALSDLRAYQERMGMTFDDPDAPVAGQAPDDGLEEWMRGDGG